MSLQNPLKPQEAMQDIATGEHFYPMTCASQVLMEDGKRLNAVLANCWLEFTDEDGNPTDEPYIHWVTDSETGKPVTTGMPNAEEGEF